LIPPEVRFGGAILDQRRLLVRVQLASDGHHAAANVDDGLDHIAELRLGG
jgi:hypothetical protein